MLRLSTWEVVFTIAVILSTILVVFIVTLPTSYVHFHPGYIEEYDFDNEDRVQKGRSGYAYFQQHKDTSGQYATKTTVQVVVLGDIGRSPRMQYHAISLAKHGAGVQLVGYLESSPSPDVLGSKFIKIVDIARIPPMLQTSSKVMFLVLGPLKALYQTWALYRALAFQASASRYMLVQNPPSIPVLAVAVFVCFFRNTKLVIDWHNFGYSILALRLGPSHPLVRISRWYEGFVSHGAVAHFTVTDAMKRKVKADFSITAISLHDRPAEQFQPVSQQQRDNFLQTCEVTRSAALGIQQGRTKLVVSSTSWTADEDFSVLLDALVSYSSSAEKDDRLPGLLVVITGKGPQKEYYQAKIRDLEQSGGLTKVTVRSAWLSIQDYATMLAAADLGICLHTSSSGVDLPMKVLDMFGSGIPVAGWSKYESWSELVHENVNGLGFGSAEELHVVLKKLFTKGSTKLEVLKQGALEEGKYRWNDEWNKTATKVFGLAP